MYFSPEGIPISREEALEWFHKAPNRVARTTVFSGDAPDKIYDVSTTYLVLDHNYMGEGPPVIYETMVFGEGNLDLECYRYSTKEQALAGHAEIVILVAATLDNSIVIEAEGCEI